MKAHALRIGKAISAALFVLLLSMVGLKNALAQNQVTTLQHEGNISAFYGINAFAEAHTAAIDGDTITLSSGNFNSCNITKAITLHGAGCVSDTLGITPTTVLGNFYLSIPNDSLSLIVEGIYLNGTVSVNTPLYNAAFLRCNISAIGSWDYNGEMHNVQFNNCLIESATVNSFNNNVVFLNCVVNTLNNWYVSQTAPSVLVFNSIIKTHYINSQYNLYLYNCIIGNANTVYGTYAGNCIQVGSAFQNSVQAMDCIAVDSYSDVFENWDGTFSFDADFSLKEEIATSFLGSDGTEVGIFGGIYPYNPRPSYLILYRCNVAGRTTIDNKLSVDVEVITGD